MPLFTSARERRLWIWVLVIVGTIYSTLFLAGEVAGFLRKQNLLGISFAVGMLLVITTIASQWLKSQPGRRELWVILGVAATYFLVWVRIENPAECTHLIEYGIVVIFIFQALNERLKNGRKVPAPAAIAVVVTTLLGLLDEVIQAILPNRVYDIRDVIFNALAGLMAIVASLLLAWARKHM